MNDQSISLPDDEVQPPRKEIYVHLNRFNFDGKIQLMNQKQKFSINLSNKTIS